MRSLSDVSCFIVVRCRKLAGRAFQNVSSFPVGLIFRKGEAGAYGSSPWKRAPKRWQSLPYFTQWSFHLPLCVSHGNVTECSQLREPGTRDARYWVVLFLFLFLMLANQIGGQLQLPPVKYMFRCKQVLLRGSKELQSWKGPSSHLVWPPSFQKKEN